MRGGALADAVGYGSQEHQGRCRQGQGREPRKGSAGARWQTSYAEMQGNGGETHQTTSDPALTMTSQQSIPVADAQNSLKLVRAGQRCEDFQLREKIFHFDHERIPERVVYARGYPSVAGRRFIPLAKGKDAEGFVTQCRKLRFWPREMAVDMDAASVRP